MDGRLVWGSGVSLLDGVVSISLLNLRVLLVVVDGSQGPDWLTFISRNHTQEGSNSELHSNYFL